MSNEKVQELKVELALSLWLVGETRPGLSNGL